MPFFLLLATVVQLLPCASVQYARIFSPYIHRHYGPILYDSVLKITLTLTTLQQIEIRVCTSNPVLSTPETADLLTIGHPLKREPLS